MTLPVLEHLGLIQDSLRQQGLDGWLLYDFRAINPIMLQLLAIPKEKKMTRRLYTWIPAYGMPVLLRHAIEHSSVADQEEIFLSLGSQNVQIYSNHRDLSSQLDKLLKEAKRIAMEVSPLGKLPYLSCVDLGTVQAIESRGIEVVSSAKTSSTVLARWGQEDLNSHLNAARVLEEEVAVSFNWVHEMLSLGRSISEYQIQQQLQHRLESRGMRMDDAPIVAMQAASADPHYVPTAEHHQIVGLNQVLLIDVWCRENKPLSRYADICRMAYTGSQPSALHQEVMKSVAQAQQVVFDRLAQSTQDLRGCDLDKLARDQIEKAGYGEFFIHRLGHSIDLQCHGSGTHLDDYETCDDRPLVSRSCFSVEPGIYLHGSFGVRLESDVYIDQMGTAHITGGRQTDWCLLDPAGASPKFVISSPLTLNL